jgi:carboxymethylenebutenolidase
MPNKFGLSVEEQKLNDVWDEHLQSEFDAHSADKALATMVKNPRVNAVPVVIGGNGKEEVHQFYANYFLRQIPPDTEMVPVSRTIGQGRVVEEMIFRFTHSIQMDWILPDVPTGKRVEIAMLVVVQFDDDRLAHEHVYWDQASVLVQVGLLQPRGLPVVGADSARSLLDRRMRLNELLHRAEMLHRVNATERKTDGSQPAATAGPSSVATRGACAQDENSFAKSTASSVESLTRF